MSEAEVRKAVQAALPKLEETLMSTLAEKWLKTGQKQGQAELLIRLLERRFGPLPERYRERIAEADTETLLVWGERVLTARQLEDIFS